MSAADFDAMASLLRERAESERSNLRGYKRGGYRVDESGFEARAHAFDASASLWQLIRDCGDTRLIFRARELLK